MTVGPVGWIVIIGTGIFAGYQLSKTSDEFAKEYSGVTYDRIMRMRK